MPTFHHISHMPLDKAFLAHMGRQEFPDGQNVGVVHEFRVFEITVGMVLPRNPVKGIHPVLCTDDLHKLVHFRGIIKEKRSCQITD